MPEIVESKQYELFCNEQMIKSEFMQMWANRKRRIVRCRPNQLWQKLVFRVYIDHLLDH